MSVTFDFLVQFKELPVRSYGNADFGLLKSLEQAFGRSMQLVDNSTIKIPVRHTGIDCRGASVLVYAA